MGPSYQEFITVRVCNFHVVSTRAIWIGWRRQSAVNMLIRYLTWSHSRLASFRSQAFPVFRALPLPCIILNANRRTKNGGGLGTRLILGGSVHQLCEHCSKSPPFYCCVFTAYNIHYWLLTSSYPDGGYRNHGSCTLLLLWTLHLMYTDYCWVLLLYIRWSLYIPYSLDITPPSFISPPCV